MINTLIWNAIFLFLKGNSMLYLFGNPFNVTSEPVGGSNAIQKREELFGLQNLEGDCTEIRFLLYKQPNLQHTCNPVATASTVFQSHVCLSEMTPTFTSNAMNTACLKV